MVHDTKPNISFKYFEANTNSEFTQKYNAGLEKALHRYEVAEVVLRTKPAIYDRETFLVLATTSFTGQEQVCGGIRIEFKDDNRSIPIEKSKTQYTNTIKDKVKARLSIGHKIAEIAGLWVSSEFKGLGIGQSLAGESTQLAFSLGADTLISFLPTHTLKYFESLGFTSDVEIPPMNYPDNRYLSTLVWLNKANVESQVQLRVQSQAAI